MRTGPLVALFCVLSLPACRGCRDEPPACPPNTVRAGDRCVPPQPGQARARLPRLEPVGWSSELEPVPALTGLVWPGQGPGVPWLSPRSAVDARVGTTGMPLGQAPAWELGMCDALTTRPAAPALDAPLEVSYLFQGDNLVGYAIGFRVVGEATRGFFDRLQRELAERLGSPTLEGNRQRFERGLAVATLERNDSPALTQLEGKPVAVARLVVAVPKPRLDAAVAAAR